MDDANPELVRSGNPPLGLSPRQDHHIPLVKDSLFAELIDQAVDYARTGPPPNTDEVATDVYVNY